MCIRDRDVYTQGRRTWVRLHEKGGKRHEMPCHHNLDAWLEAYIDGAGLSIEPKAWLFRTSLGRSGQLSARPMSQADVYRMIQRRADAAGIRTKICCHTFRATGITEYLRNGGKLEIAQQMANHESARTTGLYDRRNDQVSLVYGLLLVVNHNVVHRLTLGISAFDGAGHSLSVFRDHHPDRRMVLV